MDCCNTNKKSDYPETGNMKGGRTIKMDKKTILWIVIGILFIAVLYMIFKVGGGSTGSVVQSAGTAAKSASSYSGMVGGC